MKSPILLLLTTLLVVVQASNKLYVGNLAYYTTEATLQNAFAAYGPVDDAVIMRDRETGGSRGYGYVTFSNEADAQAAIAGLNDTELDGRPIKVSDAASRPRKPSKTGLNNQEVRVGKGRFDNIHDDDSKQSEVVVEVLRTRNGGSVLVVL